MNEPAPITFEVMQEALRLMPSDKAQPFRWPFPPPGPVLGYDAPITGPTVNGCGNPSNQHRLPLLGQGTRVRAPSSMAAPSGASFGWAGSLVPVFHPRSCAAAPTPLNIPSATGGASCT